MSSYREVRRKMAEKLGPDESDSLPCSSCRTATPRATLAMFGARCARCYRVWCSEVPKPPPLPAGVAIPNTLHAWAYRLRARLDAGQQLSRAQLDALGEFERRQGHAARVGEQRHETPAEWEAL